MYGRANRHARWREVVTSGRANAWTPFGHPSGIDITWAWNIHNGPFVHVVDMHPQRTIQLTPKGG